MNKKDLREYFKKVRKKISFERKEEAKKSLEENLKKVSFSYKNILSFANKKEEINISGFNKFLIFSKKLFLTKVEGENLKIFKIDTLEFLIKNSKFFILEPDPKKYKEENKKIIDLVLVPGLAFDKKNRRLGYGGGFYDRFLKDLKSYKVGIGFKEQLFSKDLPFEKHDIQLDELLLF